MYSFKKLIKESADNSDSLVNKFIQVRVTRAMAAMPVGLTMQGTVIHEDENTIIVEGRRNRFQFLLENIDIKVLPGSMPSGQYTQGFGEMSPEMMDKMDIYKNARG